MYFVAKAHRPHRHPKYTTVISGKLSKLCDFLQPQWKHCLGSILRRKDCSSKGTVGGNGVTCNSSSHEFMAVMEVSTLVVVMEVLGMAAVMQVSAMMVVMEVLTATMGLAKMVVMDVLAMMVANEGIGNDGKDEVIGYDGSDRGIGYNGRNGGIYSVISKEQIKTK